MRAKLEFEHRKASAVGNPNAKCASRRERPESLTVTVREACELLGFGKTSFYRAISEGRLPAKKWGKRTIVMRHDLESFLAGLPDHDQAPKPDEQAPK